MNNGHYVSYPSSVGYAATFPPRGRLKLDLRHKRANAVCPYLVTLKRYAHPARVILEWRTAALQILRYARE